MARSLSDIAKDIAEHWGNVNYAAKPYLEAMKRVNSIGDMYHADNARVIVLYFLANAGTWRGEDARRIKTELRKLLKKPLDIC